MKNYEEMSDFEINCEIARVMGYTAKGFIHDLHSGAWNPCVNASDAWPIISENNISIILDNPTMPCATANARDLFDNDDPIVCVTYDKPLRAAMIVLLKMNEGKL